MASLFTNFLTALAVVVRDKVNIHDPNLSEFYQRLGSYFWERMDNNGKQHWKDIATNINVDENLHGKEKQNAFWVFTRQFMVQRMVLDTMDAAMILTIWNGLSPIERSLWIARAARVDQTQDGQQELFERSCYKNFESGHLQKIKRIYDESLTLRCPQLTEFADKKSNTIEWTFNNKDIDASTNEDKLISFVDEQSILTIKNLKLRHEGRYKCKIENSRQIKSSIYIVKIVHEAPKITSEIKSNYSFERSNDWYTINCEATGIPKPKVTWSKDNLELNLKDDGKLKLGSNDELMINAATLDNTGDYTCTAKNDIDEDKKSTHVLIKVKPQIVKKAPTWYLVRFGNPFSVDCILAEEPSPTATVTWKAIEGGQSAFDNEDRKDFIGTRLNIKSTNERHAGTYLCEAGNIAGVDQWEIKIHVCGGATKEFCSDRLNATYSVLENDFRMYSNDRTRYIKMQGDRNLVIYKSNPNTDKWTNDRGDDSARSMWTTNTKNDGNGPYNLNMLTNGTVQVVDTGKQEPNRLVWDTISGRTPTKVLPKIEDDAKLEETDESDKPMELIIQDDGVLRLVGGPGKNWKTITAREIPN